MRRLLLPLLLLALSPRTGSGQEPRQIILDQLDAAARPAAANGFRSDADVFGNALMGALGSGDHVFLELTLVEGASYFIAAACDEDCSDLDLRLLSLHTGEVLEQDIQEDDYPMLSYTASSGGPHMLRVDMAACSEEPCFFGLRVYRR